MLLPGRILGLCRIATHLSPEGRGCQSIGRRRIQSQGLHCLDNAIRGPSHDVQLSHETSIEVQLSGTLFFPPRDPALSVTPKTEFPPFAQNFSLAPLLPFLSSSSTHLQDGLRKALRSPCMFLFFYYLRSLLTPRRKTVVPSPSWSLPSTTAWTWSWSRLSQSLLPPLALTTARSSPSARSPPSRAPTASTSSRSSPLPSMVRC